MALDYEWISGCMVGVEIGSFPLEGHEEQEGQVFILDLAILRLIFIW